MRKFLLMPDSFKGTMSSSTVCDVMKNSIEKLYDDAIIRSIPVADGGEGSVDCFLTAVGGRKISVTCSNPYFEKIDGYFGLINDEKTAVVEMAVAAGLPLVENRKNPLKTTTYGVGEIVKKALDYGVEELIMCLGGSATNDFGTGFASCMGVKFYNDKGEPFIPVGESLCKVNKIDISDVDKRIKNVKITVMCDVDNPPYGKDGASYVFAKQKGANDKEIELLDDGVKHICEIVKKDLGKDLSNLVGGGAAGAMACGLVAFFDAKLKMGIDTILDVTKFDDIVDENTIIFTGEGKIDSQSVRGKVVSGISKRAKEKGAKVIVIVGGAEGDLSLAYELGVNSIFAINRLPEDFSISKHKSLQNLKETFENVLRLIKSFDK